MIPTAEQFYFKDSLYTIYIISDNNTEELFYLLYSNSNIDSYCPYCKKESLFKPYPSDRPKKSVATAYNDVIYSYKDFANNYNSTHFTDRRAFAMTYRCSRVDHSHLLYFHMRLEDSKIFKVGQWPTVADLTESVVTKKYNNILDKSIVPEFNRAIGLHSHGVGAFVYLRRIFENLSIRNS